jgi:hypothetical protein
VALSSVARKQQCKWRANREDTSRKCFRLEPASGNLGVVLYLSTMSVSCFSSERSLLPAGAMQCCSAHLGFGSLPEGEEKRGRIAKDSDAVLVATVPHRFFFTDRSRGGLE